MAPVKVYGSSVSTCTRRVLMVLEEKNVPYELVVVDLMKGEHKKPEFLALQPFGQIPVFVDGETTLFESRAISRYIAKKWAGQGTDLLGKDAKTQALNETWLETEANHFNGPASVIFFEKVFKNVIGQTTDDAIVAAKTAELNTVLDVYEAHLAKTPYLAGSEFTLSDLSHLPYLHYIVHAAKFSLDKFPLTKAWFEKISSRPIWVKLSSQ